METLVVVALIGFIAVITIAAFGRSLQDYRLTSATRRVGGAISLARLKALSTNMNYTFTLRAGVNPNTYQITGTTDINASGTSEPWEDMYGTGSIQTDTIYTSEQSLDSPAVNHAGISGTNLPNGANVSLALDAGRTLTILFNGRGVVKSMKDDTSANKQYILIQSQGLTQAIWVEPTGTIRLYKYQNPGWTTMN